ncbi:MAG: AAA family ATPase [Phycisphaeraceae bacterium]|nr:MAG: AAA family ATPase [Phycisphaeraceae bacterium]
MGQLILLTHDFSLFRQVRNWFHHLQGQRKNDVSQRPARFFMLECISRNGQRTSTLRWVDSLLEQYESEYHFLFASVYRVWSAPPATSIADYYHVPNMARRVLEAFLAFKVPQASGELHNALQLVSFDESKKSRVLRFLHTQSHGADLDPGHDPTVLGECRAVLEDLLALMRSLDDGHFSAMVRLVNQTPTES